jgi:hypothetical protein
LAHTSVTTTTGQRIDITVQPEGRHHPGRTLRWRGGVYDVELPDGEALKLLQVLLAHYAVSDTGRVSPGHTTKLTIEVTLEAAAAEPPRRTAETCKLFGLALARLCAGEAEGLVVDETGERRVVWRLAGPARKRSSGRASSA